MMRLQVTGEIIDEAADLARRYRLRGADAIHLAATLSIHNMLSEAGQSVILVASDRELLDAGRKAGISAEDPASPSV